MGGFHLLSCSNGQPHSFRTIKSNCYKLKRYCLVYLCHKLLNFVHHKLFPPNQIWYADDRLYTCQLLFYDIIWVPFWCRTGEPQQLQDILIQHRSWFLRFDLKRFVCVKQKRDFSAFDNGFNFISWFDSKTKLIANCNSSLVLVVQCVCLCIIYYYFFFVPFN